MSEPEHYRTVMAILRRAIQEGNTVGGTSKCEWPATVGSSFKCLRPARNHALSPSGKWGRMVCGIHANVAERKGWDVARPPR